ILCLRRNYSVRTALLVNGSWLWACDNRDPAECDGAVTGSAGQSVRELPDHGIALARGAFETITVQDADVAALVLDQPDTLECACRQGDGGAAGAKHLCQKLLCDEEFLSLSAVLEHQYPTSEPLLDFVQ